jgi:hypothetical protein
LDDD